MPPVSRWVAVAGAVARWKMINIHQFSCGISMNFHTIPVHKEKKESKSPKELPRLPTFQFRMLLESLYLSRAIAMPLPPRTGGSNQSLEQDSTKGSENDPCPVFCCHAVKKSVSILVLVKTLQKSLHLFQIGPHPAFELQLPMWADLR